MTPQTLPSESNFLGIGAELSSYDSAKAVVLPVPHEATTSYIRGTRQGPAALLQASHQVEYWDDELDREPCESGIATLEPLRSVELTHEAALAQVESAAGRLFDDGKFPVTIGGEHSITAPLVRAAVERYPDLTVLQLDAHSDMRDSYEGSPLNHACVMARVNALCPFVSVGLRSGISGESSLARPESLLIYAREMVSGSGWRKHALKALGEDVYITFDLDVLDPSIMPAVGTPEPGGMLWYDTLAFLREVFSARRVVGCDVVELCPRRGMEHADFLAAKLVYKLIGYRFFM